MESVRLTMFHLFLLLLHLNVVTPYSIFGGNTYGYTGGSICAALNGCISRDAEENDGTPKKLFGPSGTQQTSKQCVLDWAYISDGKYLDEPLAEMPPSIMQVDEQAFGIDFLTLQKELDKCRGTNARGTLCDKLNESGNENLKTRLNEIFDYQILYDKSVLQNYQGALWRWDFSHGSLDWVFEDTVNSKKSKINTLWSNVKSEKCNTNCMDNLLYYCSNVYAIRHVKDWCITIHSWIDTASMNQYQSGLLWLVNELMDMDDISAASYELVAKKAECNGAELKIGKSPSLAACAESCFGKASMFAYGTNEFGNNRCSSDGTCWCYCEYASANGVCTEQIENTGYNLYKYKSGEDRLLLVNKQSREEKGVLVAAALSVVYLTKDMFEGLNPLSVNEGGKYYDMSLLGHVATHSLFLAAYVGRLRVTLHKKSANWGNPGTLVTTTDEGIDAARNFEGLTGSVYASLGALFNTKNNLGQSDDPDTDVREPTIAPLGLRFRLEVGEPNGIGCVEQTTGMIFIRPGDWIPDQGTTWKPIGPKDFGPSGAIAFDSTSKTSTLEISEGGLVMYPVTVGDVLRAKQYSMCNSNPGNGPAAQKGFNLKGIGGICNWVPTW